MTDGLRERKKAETRQALMTAAVRLAEELGPERVTVEAIAGEAGVSPRTFFNYFQSKEDAIVGVSPAETIELLEDLAARPADEAPFDSLRAMALAAAARLEAKADDMMARHRLTQAHPSLAMRRAARFTEVERLLAEVIAERTGLDVDRDPYPMLAASAALGAIRVAMSAWQERNRPGPLVDLLDETFTLLARGLPSPVLAAG